MKRYIRFTTAVTDDDIYINKGNVWEQVPHELYFDFDYHNTSVFYRELNPNYVVSIVPSFNKKTYMLDWNVMLEKTNSSAKPEKTEAFETFYDAMDFVDDGELEDFLPIKIGLQ